MWGWLMTGAVAVAGALWLAMDWSTYVTITTVAQMLRASPNDAVLIATLGTKIIAWTRESMPHAHFDNLLCTLMGGDVLRGAAKGQPLRQVRPATTRSAMFAAIVSTDAVFAKQLDGQLLLPNWLYLVQGDGTVQQRRIPLPETP